MSRKITIIGAGQVGSTVAYALTLKQIASEIVIIDIIKEKYSELDDDKKSEFNALRKEKGIESFKDASALITEDLQSLADFLEESA